MTEPGAVARLDVLAADVRLVATDLDGTLLGPDGMVSARTREVLDVLDARGIPVVFVTGRPVRWMNDLWEAVGGHGLAICSNGGVVFDVAARQVRDHVPLSRAAALTVAARIRSRIPEVTFGIEYTTGWATEPGFPRSPEDGNDGREVGPLAQIYRDDVVKLLAIHRTMDPEQFWRTCDFVGGEAVTTTWSSSFALAEISAPGVTKATTLARVAAEMGVGPEQVVAFGDMPNDLPMLSWAGTSYAMANAHPSVLAATTRQAPSNTADGVATTLTELFQLPVN